MDIIARDKIIIVFLNNLEKYELFFLEIQTQPLMILLTTLENLPQAENIQALQENKELLLVVESDFYLEQEREVKRLLPNLRRDNYIFIYHRIGFHHELGFLKGIKNCFFLPESPCLADRLNFCSYIYSLFKNLTLALRLEDFMKNFVSEFHQGELLQEKNEKIEILNAELERINKIDPLTQIFNRRAIFDFLDLEWQRMVRANWRMQNDELKRFRQSELPFRRKNDAKPKRKPDEHFGLFTLFIIDIDDFKGINDHYGHLAGDAVLKYIGELLTDSKILRQTDQAGRYGGDEFLLVLTETPVVDGRYPAERILNTIRAKTFKIENKEFTVSLSIGIASSSPTTSGLEEVLNNADAALYEAKKGGKNTYVIYTEQKKKNGRNT